MSCWQHKNKADSQGSAEAEIYAGRNAGGENAKPRGACNITNSVKFIM